MVGLPEIKPSTVQAIYDSWTANHKSYDSVGLGIGELGNECDRALWYSFRWASEREKFTGKQLRRFETGNIYEERILGELKRVPGVTVIDIDPETGDQIKVYSHGGHVRGRLDGQIHGLLEIPDTWMVVECKALNAKRFKTVATHGVLHSEPKHYMQCQKYMELTGLHNALYICVNTDNDELYAEIVPFDAPAVERLNARIERIINSSQAPPRIAENADKYPCMFCTHKEVCSKHEFGRIHCRTCIHSSPKLIHDVTDAVWHCAKFDDYISLDTQKAGGDCPEHRYLPDCVPGEQMDVDGDKVVYQLRDGSTWVDGATHE